MAKYIINVTSSKCVEVSRPNSSILVFKIPYGIVKAKTYDVKIENRFIVYILHNKNSNGKDSIYVGKSKNGLDNRPQAHNNKSESWTDCYILTTFKERTFLNDGTIQYIENALKHIIDDNEASYANTTIQTAENTANSTDEEFCKEYIEEVKEMMYLLGLNLHPQDVFMTNTKQKRNKEPYKISNDKMQNLFDNLYNTIKNNVNSDIKQESTARYIKLQLDDMILCNIENTTTELKIVFNAKKGKLEDPSRALEDVSNIGTHGSGDYRISISDNSKFDIVCDFLNQIINL